MKSNNILVLAMCLLPFVISLFFHAKSTNKIIELESCISVQDSLYNIETKYTKNLELALDTCLNDRLDMMHLPITVIKYKSNPILLQDVKWFEYELNLAENEISEMDLELFNLKKELKECQNK